MFAWKHKVMFTVYVYIQSFSRSHTAPRLSASLMSLTPTQSANGVTMWVFVLSDLNFNEKAISAVALFIYFVRSVLRETSEKSAYTIHNRFGNIRAYEYRKHTYSAHYSYNTHVRSLDVLYALHIRLL